MANDDDPSAVDTAEEQQRRPNIKSEIAFPYASLEEVYAVARTIYDAGRVPLTREQIALRMNIDPRTSTIGVKIGSAKTFGIIASLDGKYRLTPLGTNLCASDDVLAKTARVSAFLSVELYAKLADHFRNAPLPARDALEAVIVHFGVSERQKDKARQAFEKSAVFAGYMTPAKDRLVAPVFLPRNQQRDEDSDSFPTADTEDANGKNALPASHSLIKGMLDLLPTVGTKWTTQDRAKWMRTLAGNFSMIYAADDDGELEIKPKVTHVAPWTPPGYSPPSSKEPEAFAAPRSVARPPTKPSGEGTSWEPATGSLDDEIPF